MAPPFASTKANLDEQRMRSRALPLPVQRFSNNIPVILMVDLKLRFFSVVPLQQVFKQTQSRW